jgi:hypothetical protein
MDEARSYLARRGSVGNLLCFFEALTDHILPVGTKVSLVLTLDLASGRATKVRPTAPKPASK